MIILTPRCASITKAMRSPRWPHVDCPRPATRYSSGPGDGQFFGGLWGFGSFWLGSGCTADGSSLPCGLVSNLVSTGAAVPCPNNNCDWTRNGNGDLVRFRCGATACGYQTPEQMGTMNYECGTSFCSARDFVKWAIQQSAATSAAAQSQLDALNAKLGTNYTLADIGFIQGGNVNVLAPLGLIPDGCESNCRLGLLHFKLVEDQYYVHIDTANPSSFLGVLTHFSVDMFLGNIWYVVIPRH